MILLKINSIFRDKYAGCCHSAQKRILVLFLKIPMVKKPKKERKISELVSKYYPGFGME